MKECDFLIIGAGIAGASAAYELSKAGKVIVIETENQPGYHTTGRSAALYMEFYGGKKLQPLTRASKGFFANPPVGFTDIPLWSKRGSLEIAQADQMETLKAEYKSLKPYSPDLEMLDGVETEKRIPILKKGLIKGSIYDPHAMDLDVDALHQGYLRGAKSRGVEIYMDAELLDLHRDHKQWLADTKIGSIAAGTIVNAAGAWGDTVAKMAGVKPVGLIPKRRTLVLVETGLVVVDPDLPVVVDIDEDYYFRPESGKLLASPADETPVEPHDVQPEDLDVATAAWKLTENTIIDPKQIDSKWAGLRTFAPDGSPVIGYDPLMPNFFWCAGQGGYGIQTAPAWARLTAALVQRLDVPQDMLDHEMDISIYDPARFH
jgi:D-arginine dehydrogenase